MLGTYVLSAGYYDAYLSEGAAGAHAAAARLRTGVRARATSWRCRPARIPPFALGEKTDDPLQMYLADIFTVSANLAGLPAISVPCGFAERGGGARLPIGVPADRAGVRRGHAAARRRRVSSGPRAGPRFAACLSWTAAGLQTCATERGRMTAWIDEMSAKTMRHGCAVGVLGGGHAASARTARGGAGRRATRPLLPRLQAVQGEDLGRRDQRRHRRPGPPHPAAARRAAEPHHLAARGAEAGGDAHRDRARPARLRRQQQAARRREPRQLLQARDGARPDRGDEVTSASTASP